MSAFSAHADKNDLIDYAHHARGARNVFLIHGEPDQQEPLQKLLTKDGMSVNIPRRGDVAEL